MVEESLLFGQTDAVSTEGAEGPAADSSEPGERTWGETPAEFAAEIPIPEPEEEPEEELDEEPESASGDADDAPVPAPSFEDTQPLPAVAEIDQESAAELGDGPAPEAEIESVAEAEADDGTLPVTEAEPEPVPAPGEAEVAALALLQRGVDLFNVSEVPRKIAETNEQLGVPAVHAAADDGPNVAITFMWSMGWYRFRVDTVSGDATMADRGYEEISDLPPNAGVRDDGTVHLLTGADRECGSSASSCKDEAAGRAPTSGVRRANRSPRASSRRSRRRSSASRCSVSAATTNRRTGRRRGRATSTGSADDRYRQAAGRPRGAARPSAHLATTQAT